MRLTAKRETWHPWVTVRDENGTEVACFWNDPDDYERAPQLAAAFVRAMAQESAP